MRVSECFGINLNQGSLDFVDVDIENDIEVFLDPNAVRALDGEWGAVCRRLIDSFFENLMDALKRGDKQRGIELLSGLREPNEIHMGLSTSKSRGRTLGPESSNDLWSALSSSDLAVKGNLHALEEASLVVEGIGVDITSDITCNLIRAALIPYTEIVSAAYNIPLSNGIESGPIWTEQGNWTSAQVDMPRTPRGKLLLVPKIIVRRKLHFNIDDYYRDYIIEDIRHDQIANLGALVDRRKDGSPFVTRKKIEAAFGTGKQLAIQQTHRNIGLLERYRADRATHANIPLSHEEIAVCVSEQEPDWDALLSLVLSTPVGRDNANEYERRCFDLLTALFYPEYSMPEFQQRLHEGRKRVDMSFMCATNAGIIGNLNNRFHCVTLPIECKNYKDDLSNPEIDQLTGRFSHDRGFLGFIVCRRFDDREAWENRCYDVVRDNRGLVITITDEDLVDMVNRRKQQGSNKWVIIEQQVSRIIRR